MKKAVRILVPAGETVVGPDTCPVCSRPCPAPPPVLVQPSHPAGLLPWLLRRRLPIPLPIHPACGRRLACRMLAGAFLAPVIGIIVALAGLGFGLSKFSSVALALLAAAPAIFWDVFRPPAVRFIHSRKGVVVEFGDPEHAQRFAEANQKASPPAP